MHHMVIAWYFMTVIAVSISPTLSCPIDLANRQVALI